MPATSSTILAALGRWTMRIIKRSDTAEGFEMLPRRWVVELNFAWRGRCRRLTKDFEATIESAYRLDADRPRPQAHPNSRESLIYNGAFRVRQ
jgi:transposase